MARRRPHLFSHAGGEMVVEYALIGALVVLVVIGSMVLLGDRQTGLFAHMQDHIGTAIDGALASRPEN